MEKVRPWCGQPSDRGRLKNRTEQICVYLRTVFKPALLTDVCCRTAVRGLDATILRLPVSSDPQPANQSTALLGRQLQTLSPQIRSRDFWCYVNFCVYVCMLPVISLQRFICDCSKLVYRTEGTQLALDASNATTLQSV